MILLSIAAVAMAIAAFIIMLRTDRNRRGFGNGHKGEE